MSNPLFFLIISTLISVILGYPSIFLAKQFGLIDVPGSAPHKAHAKPTPLAGGILLALVLFIVAFAFRQWLTREVLIVFAGTVAAVASYFLGNVAFPPTEQVLSAEQIQLLEAQNEVRRQAA